MSETKLNKNFQPQQFVKDFEIKARKDRDRHSNGLKTKMIHQVFIPISNYPTTPKRDITTHIIPKFDWFKHFPLLLENNNFPT